MSDRGTGVPAIPMLAVQGENAGVGLNRACMDSLDLLSLHNRLIHLFAYKRRIRTTK